MRVRGAARVVDDDAAAGARGQAGRAGQLVARPHPGRDDDDVHVEAAAVGEVQPPDRAAPVDPHPLGRGADPHGDAEGVDEPAQRLAAAEVDLGGHEVRAELDDRAGRAERLQRAGGLEPEQPAADDGAAHAPAGRGLLLDPAAQRGDVVDGAVDEDAGQVVALDRRHRGARAGRQHELVVGPGAAVGDAHGPGLAVELDDGGARARGSPAGRPTGPACRARAPRGRARRSTTSARPGRTGRAAPRPAP